MDMKKILQAFDGASSKPVQGANDMKKFLSIVNESANPYKPVEETVITSFEEGSVGGDANAFLIAADKINDEVMGQIDKIKINADEQLLKNLMAKFNEFMSAYHAVGKEILQPDMFDELPGDATSTDNTDESVEESVAVSEDDGGYYYEILAKKVFADNPNLSTKGRANDLFQAGIAYAVQDLGKKRAQWEFNYDEDFFSDFVSAYGELQREHQGVEEGWGAERQARELAASNARWAPYVEKYKDDPVMSDYFKFHRIYGGNTPEQAEAKALADVKAKKKLPDWWTNPKPVGGYKLADSIDQGLSFKDYYNLSEAKKGLE